MSCLLLAARADFGFGNPNLAGALFAMLAVGAWGGWGKGKTSNIERPAMNVEPGMKSFGLGIKGLIPYGFWVYLVLSGVFGGMMVMTASRGAVVALVAGVFAYLWAAGFPRPRGRQMAGFFGVLVVFGVFVGFGRMGERMAESSGEDGSITSRVAIFKAMPSMLAAAPQGWGVGQSAEAYQNWFQAPEDIRTYKHLLSTHATWMVERGRGFRFLYILGWMVVLILCANAPASLGVWVVYGAAGIFSHVGGDWRLGVLPALALALALWRRAVGQSWPEGRTWRNGVLVAGVLTAGLAMVGELTNKGILRVDESVRVGIDRPKIWYFAPDIAVLGKAYGKAIRKRESVGAAWDMAVIRKALPSEIVLSGSAPIGEGDKFSPACAITWLNPPARLDGEQQRILEMATKKTIIWGEQRSDANPRRLKAWFEELPGGQWIFVRGKGLFLGDSLGDNKGAEVVLP